MYDRDPFAMNWLEVRILNHLSDRGHPVGLHAMKDGLVPGSTTSVVNTIFHLRDEGLVKIFETALGGQLVDITAVGKAVLHDVLVHSRHNCD